MGKHLNIIQPVAKGVLLPFRKAKPFCYLLNSFCLGTAAWQDVNREGMPSDKIEVLKGLLIDTLLPLRTEEQRLIQYPALMI